MWWGLFCFPLSVCQSSALLEDVRENVSLCFIAPLDRQLDSLRTWLSVRRPERHTRTRPTVVVCRETVVLWYCFFLFFPPSMYSVDWALSAHQSHHNLSVSLTICPPHHTTSIYDWAQTMHKLKHICICVWYGRDSAFSLITVHLTLN